MFGSQLIIGNESISGSSQCNLTDEVSIRLGSSPVEPTTMCMQDRGSLFRLRGFCPPTRYPSDRRRFKADFVGNGNLFHDVVERTAAGGSFNFSFHRGYRRAYTSHCGRVFLGDRMQNRPRNFRSWAIRRLSFHFLLSLGRSMPLHCTPGCIPRNSRRQHFSSTPYEPSMAASILESTPSCAKITVPDG